MPHRHTLHSSAPLPEDGLDAGMPLPTSSPGPGGRPPGAPAVRQGSGKVDEGGDKEMDVDEGGNEERTRAASGWGECVGECVGERNADMPTDTTISNADMPTVRHNVAAMLVVVLASWRLQLSPSLPVSLHHHYHHQYPPMQLPLPFTTLCTG